MKTLHLNLKKKWFDMILSGEKKEEYREIKPYWENRLFSKFNNSDIEKSLITKNGFIGYSQIIFSNGYSKNRPQFVIEFKGIEIREGNPDWGAEPGVKYFVLKLGSVIKTENL